MYIPILRCLNIPKDCQSNFTTLKHGSSTMYIHSLSKTEHPPLTKQNLEFYHGLQQHHSMITGPNP